MPPVDLCCSQTAIEVDKHSKKKGIGQQENERSNGNDGNMKRKEHLGVRLKDITYLLNLLDRQGLFTRRDVYHGRVLSNA